MKTKCALFFLLLALAACGDRKMHKNAANNAPMRTADLLKILHGPLPPFDSTAAAQGGADQYGMHPYVMAFLKRGPNRPQDKEKAAALQKAHMENIGRMADEGKLVLAGPFLDNGDLRGIYVFNVRTVEEAEALTKTDPAIQAGSLVMELHPWYGSAALLHMDGIHKRLDQNSAKMEQ